ncbi:hypothetical protein Bbelb_411550 [Branchiostoma belcheri]|nr:hypothetical protein Bbelb_411550 [Branchiostoma belcheri]
MVTCPTHHRGNRPCPSPSLDPECPPPNAVPVIARPTADIFDQSDARTKGRDNNTSATMFAWFFHDSSSASEKWTANMASQEGHLVHSLHAADSVERGEGCWQPGGAHATESTRKSCAELHHGTHIMRRARHDITSFPHHKSLMQPRLHSKKKENPTVKPGCELRSVENLCSRWEGANRQALLQQQLTGSSNMSRACPNRHNTADVDAAIACKGEKGGTQQGWLWCSLVRQSLIAVSNRVRLSPGGKDAPPQKAGLSESRKCLMRKLQLKLSWRAGCQENVGFQLDGEGGESEISLDPMDTSGLTTPPYTPSFKVKNNKDIPARSEMTTDD